MEINGVVVEDMSAETFSAPFARLIVTARTGGWAYAAAQEATGCATSIIDCGCEAGIESAGAGFKTVDGRPGHSLLFFAKSKKMLERELVRRVGQVCLPTPTVMVFNGQGEGDDFELGKKIGYFGNGFESRVEKFGRKCVAVPITSGEFVIEKSVKISQGVGGANFWIYAASQKSGLKSAERAVEAIRGMPGLILPFAGGVVASPSRFGSTYSTLKASTQEDFCPTIGADKNPNRKLPDGVGAVFEIVIDAVSLEVARKAMKAGIEAACIGGVVKIGAASFGGKLGDIFIPLRGLFT
jgi:formylmethanofuran--tetrahydromethanopterin N-formyltransferase